MDHVQGLRTCLEHPLSNKRLSPVHLSLYLALLHALLRNNFQDPVSISRRKNNEGLQDPVEGQSYLCPDFLKNWI